MRNSLEVKLQSKMKVLKIYRLLKILQNLIRLKNLMTVQKLNQLQKLKMALSKQIYPRIHSSTSLHILRIKSLGTKTVLEEQDHISDKKSL